MIGEEKIKYFQYILFKLLDGSNKDNDLSVLKALKLLFFISAVKANKNDSDSLIDSVFTQFYAMPYGHVETDIYKEIKDNSGELDFITINSDETTIKDQVDYQTFSQLNPTHLSKINDSINFLKEHYGSLFNLKAFQLVELSHMWYSWRKNYNLALQDDKKSWLIPKEDIKSESKIFTLQSF